MNSSSPKLSVVMSVKNNFKNYLELSVQSILDQTFNDFEFIIIVDGGDKNVLNVLESFKLKDQHFYI